MFNKILWICPSRNRPEKLQTMIDSWKQQTEGLSDLLIAIDSDDRSNDSLIVQNEHPNLLWEVGDPIGHKFLQLLNKYALKYIDQYKYIGFMEDDCIFKTPYESRFIEKFEELGPLSLVHGNDLVNCPTLVSLPVISSEVIKRLGFFAPPEINCLWADYFWRSMRDYGVREHYFPDIIIQHVHYSRVDNIRDETAINMELVAQSDYLGYQNYKNSGKLAKDMERLNAK